MPTLVITLPNGEKQSFDESEFECIRFGRDQSWADIILDEELREKGVGNEHCELVASAGCFTLQTDGKHHVWLDGNVAYDEDILPRNCTISFIKDSNEASFHLETIVSGGGATQLIDPPPPLRRGSGFKRAVVVSILLLSFVVFYRYLDRDSLNQQQIEAIQDRVFSVQTVVNDRTSHAGTAWLAGKNIVVTNRHVGKFVQQSLKYQAEGIGGGAFIRFRSQNNKEGKIKTIKNVIFHPAEDAYKSFLKQHPARPNSDFSLHLEIYDVAILELDGEAIDLSPLPLATEQEYQSLNNGEPLILTGFPLNKGKTEWDLFKPVAEISRGTFDKTRNAFSSEGIRKVNPLLSYDISTAGGNSGSPVFTEQGKVIAIHFAGTKKLIDEKLVGGGNSYGQSVRLVKQFVDGSIFSPEVLKQEENIWMQWLSTATSIEQTKVTKKTRNTELKYRCVYQQKESWQALEANNRGKRIRGSREYNFPVVGEYLVFVQSLDPSGAKIGVSAHTDSGAFNYYGSNHYFDFSTQSSSVNEAFKLTLNGPNTEADYSVNIYVWSDSDCKTEGYTAIN